MHLLSGNKKFILGLVLVSLAAYGGIQVDNHLSTQDADSNTRVVTKQLSEFAAKQLTTDLNNHKLDGQPVTQHPRIFLTFLQNWQGKSVHPVFQERMALFKQRKVVSVNPCVYKSVLGNAGCWVTKPEKEIGEQLVKSLFKFYLMPPESSGYYGNAWKLALAYDLACTYPGFSQKDRVAIEKRLEKQLEDLLDVLEEDGLSMWHGRASVASQAFLLAMVLDHSSEHRQELLKRSQAYFLDLMAALDLTEAWPEGYNYWIQNRAIPIALASAAYVNGLRHSQQAEKIREIIRRAGYWVIYATRPDDKIEGLGDEGSRIDLKDVSRPYIDFIAQLTQDSELAEFSEYLYQVHEGQSYYDGWRWAFRLFNDPQLVQQPVKSKQLVFARNNLPTADIFGKGAFNQAYIRSGWSDQDTLISFRAGHQFSHHGHYDAGHFTIHKQRPLAINSSTYDRYDAPHRLNYAIRSVAKNTLLIMRPGEKVKPNKFFQNNVADGGQRIIQPTGSSIPSVSHWYKNLYKGKHLEGGTIARADLSPAYSYLYADLTGAYNNSEYDDNSDIGKVNKVTRELFYLREQDQLLIYDTIAATSPAYIKKWLLHSVYKPAVKGLKVIKGKAHNGILTSDASEATITNGNSRLFLKKLLPVNGKLNVIGGPDYRYYVDIDGDGHTWDGINFDQGASDKKWFDSGFWRLELTSTEPKEVEQFLVVLTPRIGKKMVNQSDIKVLKAEKNYYAVQMKSSVVVFLADSTINQLDLDWKSPLKKIYLVGLAPKQQLEVKGQSSTTNSVPVQKVAANLQGTAVMTISSQTTHVQIGLLKKLATSAVSYK
ncbi:hypothetical protein [Spartinivicinus poritis]|uniref:Heparinase II/III-like protein n=1 Tax=Spartinivicinus poritis TaxID=2994640 RepID=A0ABT5UFA1_9GAMM|nr:hypothetical protein [Spartinivicinus sp. A2-2]MDE1464987.1 hypothetical protein [Spartinivicinus sp. A2-2]